MRFFLAFCSVLVWTQELCAAIQFGDEAMEAATGIVVWTSYPRLTNDENLELSAKQIQNHAYEAAQENLGLALTIQQTLIADLEKKQIDLVKLNEAWILENARITMAEFEAVRQRSRREQKEYRALLREYCQIIDADKACEAHLQALVKLSESLMKYDPDKVWNLTIVLEQSLGTYYLALHEPAKAAECFRNVALRRKEQFGTLNNHYIFAVNYLGYALLDLQDHAQAEAHFREVLSTLRSLKRKQSLVYADAQTGLAAALIGQQRFPEAETLSASAYYIVDNMNFQRHAIQAYCYRNSGDIAMAHGEYQEAAKYYKWAVKFYDDAKPFLTNQVVQATQNYRTALQATLQHEEVANIDKALEALKQSAKEAKSDY